MNVPARPAMVVIDPAGPTGATMTELCTRYAAHYDIEVHEAAGAALDALQAMAARGADVAVVLADRASGGARLLNAVRPLHPSARRGLLLDWNEHRTHREEIAEAFAQRHVECVVTRPLGSSDERFHRNVTELLDEWSRLRGSVVPTVRIVCAQPTARVSEIQDMLQRHDVPFSYAGAAAATAGPPPTPIDGSSEPVPVVTLHNGHTLINPTNVELAHALGARTRSGAGVYDVVVVGGGPAGLSAAVYAESEGLRTALIEPIAMGGQAGTSSMIRNYLGFPRGISGAELAARAFEQAILFGTEMIYGSAAVGIRADGQRRLVQLSDGTAVTGRAIVIATGVAYRSTNVPSVERFKGVGVYYGAATSEAPSLAGRSVFVVGGGNSAGQAALHLARYARSVTMLIRGDSLASSMSDYLITEISETSNIQVRRQSEVQGADGDGRLETLHVRDSCAGTVSAHAADALFILIGAAPFTNWLPDDVERDEWGYVFTGPTPSDVRRLPFESSMSGVFAVGDVRRDSVKRVASAVGEGAVGVRQIHDYIAQVQGSHV
jgi:thioredoxin reductase (NADPH)